MNPSQTCVSAHQRVKVTREHKIVPIESGGGAMAAASSTQSADVMCVYADAVAKVGEREALRCYERAALLFRSEEKWSQAGETFFTLAKVLFTCGEAKQVYKSLFST